MAYVKKSVEESDADEAPIVSQEVAETKTKKVDDQSAEIAALKAQIEMLTKLISANAASTNAPPSNPLYDRVKIVHLIERAPDLYTDIKLDTTSIRFSSFGEERSITYQQAEELAGKCRKLFNRGEIAFGAENSDIAERFGLKSVKDYAFMGSDFVKRLGTMNVYELEDIYNKLCDGHKKFVIEYFKRKIIDGDPAFNEIHKIELLQRLSNGAMSDCLPGYNPNK